VTLEPNPTPYNGTTTYVQMYSGSPYPLGLDPVCFHLFFQNKTEICFFRFGN
jgi:hypothetical protein